MKQNALNWGEWEEILIKINNSLNKKNINIDIEIIGSALLMKEGMYGRTSMDLDVWNPNSNISNLDAFKEAAIEAGIIVDDTGSYEGDKPYIQLIDELKEMPKHDIKSTSTLGSLTLSFPSPNVIAASKLACGRSKDLEDLAFMNKREMLNFKGVHKYIQALPSKFAQTTALENFVYIDIPITKNKNIGEKEKLFNKIKQLRKDFRNEKSEEVKELILNNTISKVKEAVDKKVIRKKYIKEFNELIKLFIQNKVDSPVFRKKMKKYGEQQKVEVNI